jgi:hypothetical protein
MRHPICVRFVGSLSNAPEVSCEKRDAKRNEREQLPGHQDSVEQRALFDSFTGSVRPQARTIVLG